MEEITVEPTCPFQDIPRLKLLQAILWTVSDHRSPRAVTNVFFFLIFRLTRSKNYEGPVLI